MNIRGMLGLGDNIYQRAFVRVLRGPVRLETPWPELYADLPGIEFVRPDTRLRTQGKNIRRQAPARWLPGWRVLRGDMRQIHYGTAGIIPGMRRAFGVAPGTFDLPPLGASPLQGRYAVVRPVTVRSEWIAEARNPLPEYITEAAAALRAAGVTVVSVADLVPGVEWALDPLPPADVQFHRGELAVGELLALVRDAVCVVGGIGWLLPAAIAAAVPAWIVCGGQGGYNAPELLTDPAAMSLDRLRFAVPDQFCRCRERRHTCDKRIANHAEHFAEWLSGLLAVEPGAAHGVSPAAADGLFDRILGGIPAAG